MEGIYTNYTWDDFFEVFESEKESGSSFQKSAYIALELVKPTLFRMQEEIGQADSITHREIIQKAYKVIADNLGSLDKPQAELESLVREELEKAMMKSNEEFRIQNEEWEKDD